MNKQRAINSEAATIKKLTSMGLKPYPNSDVMANGVDMYATSDKRVFSIEIKTAKNNGKKGWSVKKCLNQDLDWISIVFPDGVIIQPMLDHLRCCGPKGTRGVTKLREMLIAGENSGDVL